MFQLNEMASRAHDSKMVEGDLECYTEVLNKCVDEVKNNLNT